MSETDALDRDTAFENVRELLSVVDDFVLRNALKEAIVEYGNACAMDVHKRMRNIIESVRPQRARS